MPAVTETPPTTSSPKQKALAAAREAVLLDYLRLRALRPENRTAAARQAERGLKAVRLAPTLEVCRALLRGERIPDGQLHQDAARRYGHRHRNGH